jgi:predicted HAD superfamily Cof-like phosphohydrolase
MDGAKLAADGFVKLERTQNNKKKGHKMDSVFQVMEFHIAAGHIAPAKPDVSKKELNDFRIALLAEEFYELQQALNRGEVVNAFDALLDLQYVLDGTFIQLGFAPFKKPGFDEVHRSNMTKEFPADNSTAKKIAKGPNYQPPQLELILGL